MKILLFCILILNCVLCQENLNELKQFINVKNAELDKKFENIVMGYLTPWNKNGKNIALQYFNKFDIVSPAWFEIEPENLNNKFNIKVNF